MSSGQTGIFVATMTGLAQMCAEEIETALKAAGTEPEILMMDGLGADAFAPYDTLVIVSSTYGQGEIPDNGLALFAEVEAGIDLAGKRYAIFALGDRTYSDTYCAAGDRWNAALTACGATPFTDLQRHDASAGTFAEDVAGEWAAGWANGLSNGDMRKAA